MLRYLENQCQCGLGRLGENPCLNSRTATLPPRMEGPTLAFMIVVDGVGVVVANQTLVMENNLVTNISTTLNVSFMGIIKLVIVIHGWSL